jgi:hypothetical protein
MPTPSGTISLLDIQNEFGGSSPISLSEYYALAGFVPGGQGVPSSGVISFNDLRGKTKIFDLSAASGTTLYNINVRTALVGAGWDGSSPAIYRIPATTYITSASTANPALLVAGSFPNGITIVNSGYILGRGGNGGSSGGGSGAAGGTALRVEYIVGQKCNIDNKGTIAGGGGGGGGGQTGDNYSSGGGGGGAPLGISGPSSYFNGGANATIANVGGTAPNIFSPPYGGYGADRWGSSGGNGGAWGTAGNNGNAGGGRNGPGAGGRAGAWIDGYNYSTIVTRGTVNGEIKFGVPVIGMADSTQYQISNRGINTIKGGAYAISTFVKAGGNSPAGTGVQDDVYWGPLDPKKYGATGFPWYLYGTNIMNNFHLSSNSGISAPNPNTTFFGSTSNPSDVVKFYFNNRDLQTYNAWLTATANPANRAFQIYYGSELYGKPGVYDTKELIFYNPLYTGGYMVVLIKYGGNGSLGAYQGGGTHKLANENGSKVFEYSGFAGPGLNVVLIGDPVGDNWQAFRGYAVTSAGAFVDN